MLVAAGMRSLGLVWSGRTRSRPACRSSFRVADRGPGLSVLGSALVRACSELGVIVDVSHLNARGFWDVAALTEAPLVASHGRAHALSPSPRNLADDQLRAIGESGGIVGINFHVGFLRADCADDADTPVARIAEHAAHVAEVAGVVAVGLAPTSTAHDAEGAGRRDGAARRALAALGAVGFSEDDVAAIAWDNWIRVLRQTWTSVRSFRARPDSLGNRL